MPRYRVHVPVVYYDVVTIGADSPEEALEAVVKHGGGLVLPDEREYFTTLSGDRARAIGVSQPMVEDPSAP